MRIIFSWVQGVKGFGRAAFAAFRCQGLSVHMAEGSGVKSFWGEDSVGGPQYRPQYTIVLIIGTPKKVYTSNLRKPPCRAGYGGVGPSGEAEATI